MTLKPHVLILYILSIQALYLVGCSTGVKPEEKAGAAPATSVNQMGCSDKELLEMVDRFAAYVSETGQDAWRKIDSCPRDDLISSLLRIQNSLTENDIRRINIAFVLCNLNYDYQTNRQVIISALTKIPFYIDPKTGVVLPVDAAGELIGRLIRRGDKDLLTVLLKAAQWADGAFAEGLGDTFSFALQSDPEDFLGRLKSEPNKIRQRVYGLLDLSLSTESRKQVNAYLLSVPRNSPIAQISKEMLRKVSFKED